MVLVAGLVGDATSAPNKQGPTAAAVMPGGQASELRKTGSHAAVPLSVDAQNELVSSNCSICHDDEAKAGGLSLQSFDAAKIEQNLEVVEKMIRKLRAGMMPPPGVQRPDADTLGKFVTALETAVDTAAALHPYPGRRPFQRLNRAEYARAVHDLLDLDVDVNAFLPPDTISDGFDNIADVQTFSPTLMEGYLARLLAGSPASRWAIAVRGPSEATYKVPRTQSQMRHIDGHAAGARAAASPSSTHFRPTATTPSASCCTARRRASCSAVRRAATSSSKCRSTASAWRCSTSTTGSARPTRTA